MKTLQAILLGLVGLLAFYVVRQHYRAIDVIEDVDVTREESHEKPPGSIRVLTRRGYFSPELVKEAEETLNVTFAVYFYRTADECQQAIDSNRQFDLMLVPERIALRLDRLDTTFDIDYEKIPNHRNMVLGLQMPQELGALFRCSVPLFITALGIGYNANYVSSIPLSWSALFEPQNPSLMRGHLGLLNDSRRCLGIALIAQGKSPNSTDAAEIRAAGALVKQCMVLLPAMERTGSSIHGGADYIAQLAVRRRVFVGMVTGAAISRAMNDNAGLRFSCPNEGTLLSIDCLVIPRTTRDRALTEKCINFLIQPRISAQLTNESGVATTNEGATAYVDRKLFRGPAYATPSGRQFFYLRDVGDAERIYQDTWRELQQYYHTEVAPIIDRELGFDHVFIESNDKQR